MNFDWLPEDAGLRKDIADLFSQEIRQELPLLDEADENGLRRMTLKYLGLLARTEYLVLGVGPGRLGDCVRLAGAQEELSGVSGSLFLAVEYTARLFGGLLSGWGPDAVKSGMLERIGKGGLIAGVAISEPGGAEPFEGWKTRAIKDGGHYRVSGVKSLVANGPIADWLAVAGDIDGQTAFFLMQPGQDGLTAGPRLKTLGYNGLAVCSLEMKDVRVPESHVLGPFEDHSALDFLAAAQDLVLAAASLGVIRRTHEAASDHAHAHHRGPKPIFAHQEVRFKLADTFTYLQTCQLLFYRAAWMIASGDREAPVLVNCAKVFCAEAAESVAGAAMQIMAGRGYVSGNAVEAGYRDAKFAALAGTTSEVSRMSIADELFKRYPV